MQQPPRERARSMMATRLPKYAAWAPAFSPAGPQQMTIKSKLSLAATFASPSDWETRRREKRDMILRFACQDDKKEAGRHALGKSYRKKIFSLPAGPGVTGGRRRCRSPPLRG